MYHKKMKNCFIVLLVFLLIACVSSDETTTTEPNNIRESADSNENNQPELQEEETIYFYLDNISETQAREFTLCMINEGLAFGNFIKDNNNFSYDITELVKANEDKLQDSISICDPTNFKNVSEEDEGREYDNSPDTKEENNNDDITTTTTTTTTTTEPVNPIVEIINYSDFTDKELLTWSKLALDKVLVKPKNFLSVVWPIGDTIDDEPDPDKFDGAPFNESEVLLATAQLDIISEGFSQWQLKLDCVTSDRIRKDINERSWLFDLWLYGGADIATAPDPCFNGRSAIYAWPKSASRQDAITVYFHETYHALSNYLATYCMNDYNIPESKMNTGRWFAEGTAQYFGLYMESDVNSKTDYVQRMLKESYLDYQGDGGDLHGPATYQAAAIHLMIERGVITKDQIISASIFNNCDWVDTFSKSKPEINFIFENFHKIELTDGKYSFTQKALKP